MNDEEQETTELEDSQSELLSESSSEPKVETTPVTESKPEIKAAEKTDIITGVLSVDRIHKRTNGIFYSYWRGTLLGKSASLSVTPEIDRRNDYVQWRDTLLSNNPQIMRYSSFHSSNRQCIYKILILDHLILVTFSVELENVRDFWNNMLNVD